VTTPRARFFDRPAEARAYIGSQLLARWFIALSIVVGTSFIGLAVKESPSSAATTAGTPATYVGLPAQRIADTRPGSTYTAAGESLNSNESIGLMVAGVGGVPSANVSAVVLNVTAVNPSMASYITVFPSGTIRPLVANLNVISGETLSNLVTVPLGVSGAVSIYNHSGNVNVVVDLEGYYTTSAPATTGLYNPVNPMRTLGTITSGASIGPGVSRSVSVVGGTTGVPPDAEAVVVNVTVAKPTDAGFLTAFPAPNSGRPVAPPVATLNFGAGQTVGNRAVISVGDAGDIEIYNHAGSVSVDVDLYGYYTGTVGDLGSAYIPITPTRFVDTRIALNGTPSSAMSIQSFNFLGDGVSPTDTAIAINVTAISGGSSGYLTIFPSNEGTPPEVGDLNFREGEISQDFASPALERGSISILSDSTSTVNIVIDAFGYFAPPPRTVRIVASPATVVADGSATSTITVTVTTGSGVAFDDPVSLTTTPSVPGACGTTSATGSTNAFGQVASSYTASDTPGKCTITAVESNGGVLGSAVIAQTET
jgi:hypothetical protein